MSDRDYTRKQPYGWDRIGVSIISHPGEGFDATLGIDVRINAIADLCNEFRTDLDPKWKKIVSTVGGNLGNLMGRGQDRWPVSDDQTLQAAIGDMTAAIHRDAIPYFVRFSDIRQVLEVCSSDDYSIQYGPTIHCPADFGRAMNAMAAAHILGD